MIWSPPGFNSRAAQNNQLAAAQRSASVRSSAGQGLSRGAGQRAMDQYRQGVGQATGEMQAASIGMEDDALRRQMATQARFGRQNERLQYDSLAEQGRQNAWDSRFNNMTSAWGALAGLLR